MSSPDGRYILSYNGEIYNFRALARELHSRGHHFRGHSDTEVMLGAIAEWGIEDALRRFQGMFAFALWDSRDQRLILARDRVGKKPLYFGWCGSTFLFGSKLKALRAHAGIDRDSLTLYLQYSWVPGPRSIYSSIEKLPAGHWLEIAANGSRELHSYWSATDAALSGQRDPFHGSLDQAVDRLEELLSDAVSCRMVADVPLGSLLSGGYDSTTISAFMQSISATPIKTFTIGFSDKRYDESVQAREIATHLGTDHTELMVSPRDALDIIPQLPAMYDEPFADASQIPTHIVSRLARGEVTVALSGDGGDELFAGYGRYRRVGRDLARWGAAPGPLHATIANLLDLCSEGGWKILQPADRRNQLPGWRRFPARLNKNVAALRAADEVDLFALQRSRLRNGADYVHGAHGSTPSLAGLTDERGLAEPMQGMMLLDFCNYLVDDILVKVDRASMAVGLEVRAPFLDYRIVEFAWSLPLPLRYEADGGKLVKFPWKTKTCRFNPTKV